MSATSADTAGPPPPGLPAAAPSGFPARATSGALGPAALGPAALGPAALGSGAGPFGVAGRPASGLGLSGGLPLPPASASPPPPESPLASGSMPKSKMDDG